MPALQDLLSLKDEPEKLYREFCATCVNVVSWKDLAHELRVVRQPLCEGSLVGRAIASVIDKNYVAECSNAEGCQRDYEYSRRAARNIFEDSLISLHLARHQEATVGPGWLAERIRDLFKWEQQQPPQSVACRASFDRWLLLDDYTSVLERQDAIQMLMGLRTLMVAPRRAFARCNSVLAETTGSWLMNVKGLLKPLFWKLMHLEDQVEWASFLGTSGTKLSGDQIADMVIKNKSVFVDALSTLEEDAEETRRARDVYDNFRMYPLHLVNTGHYMDQQKMLDSLLACEDAITETLDVCDWAEEEFSALEVRVRNLWASKYQPQHECDFFGAFTKGAGAYENDATDPLLIPCALCICDALLPTPPTNLLTPTLTHVFKRFNCIGDFMWNYHGLAGNVSRKRATKQNRIANTQDNAPTLRKAAAARVREEKMESQRTDSIRDGLVEMLAKVKSGIDWCRCPSKDAPDIVAHLRLFQRPGPRAPARLIPAIDCWRGEASTSRAISQPSGPPDYVNPAFDWYADGDYGVKHVEGLYVYDDSGEPTVGRQKRNAIPLRLKSGLYQRDTFKTTSGVKQTAVFPVPMDNPRFNLLVHREGLEIDERKCARAFTVGVDAQRQDQSVEKIEFVKAWSEMFNDSRGSFACCSAAVEKRTAVEPWPIASVRSMEDLTSGAAANSAFDIAATLEAIRDGHASSALSGTDGGRQTSRPGESIYAVVFYKAWAERYGVALAHARLPSIFFVDASRFSSDVRKLTTEAASVLASKHAGKSSHQTCLRYIITGDAKALRKIQKHWAERNKPNDGGGLVFLYRVRNNEMWCDLVFSPASTFPVKRVKLEKGAYVDRGPSQHAEVWKECERTLRGQGVTELTPRMPLMSRFFATVSGAGKPADCGVGVHVQLLSDAETPQQQFLAIDMKTHFFRWFMRLLLVRGSGFARISPKAPCDVESVFDLPLCEVTDADNFVTCLYVRSEAWRGYFASCFAFVTSVFGQAADAKNVISVLGGVPVGLKNSALARITGSFTPNEKTLQEVVLTTGRSQESVGEQSVTVLYPKLVQQTKSNAQTSGGLIPWWEPGLNVRVGAPVFMGLDVMQGFVGNISHIKRKLNYLLGRGKRNTITFGAIDDAGNVATLAYSLSNDDADYFITANEKMPRINGSVNDRNFDIMRLFIAAERGSSPVAHPALPLSVNTSMIVETPPSDKLPLTSYVACFPNILAHLSQSLEDGECNMRALDWPRNPETVTEILNNIQNRRIYAVPLNKEFYGQMLELISSTTLTLFDLGPGSSVTVLCANTPVAPFKDEYRRAINALMILPASAPHVAFERVMLTTRFLMLSLADADSVEVTVRRMLADSPNSFIRAVTEGSEKLRRDVQQNFDRNERLTNELPIYARRTSYVDSWRIYREHRAIVTINNRAKDMFKGLQRCITMKGFVETTSKQLQALVEESKAYSIPFLVEGEMNRDACFFKIVFRALTTLAEAALLNVLIDECLIGANIQPTKHGVQRAQDLYSQLEQALQVLCATKSFACMPLGDSRLRVFFDCCYAFSTLTDAGRPVIVELALSESNPEGLKPYCGSLSTAWNSTTPRARGDTALKHKQLSNSEQQKLIDVAQRELPIRIIKRPNGVINAAAINEMLREYHAPQTSKRNERLHMKYVVTSFYEPRYLQNAYNKTKKATAIVSVYNAEYRVDVMIPKHRPVLGTVDVGATTEDMLFHTMVLPLPSPIEVTEGTTLSIRVYAGVVDVVNLSVDIKIAKTKLVYPGDRLTMKVWVDDPTHISQIQILNASVWTLSPNPH